MFKNPTVLIVGAGGSIPYGFPSGYQLVKHLCEVNPGDVVQKFRSQNGFSPENVSDFCKALKYSAHASIDAFLGDRPDLKMIGQYLLAERLMFAEFDSTGRFEALDNDWYGALVRCIAPKRDRIAENKLSIITFNYDRSLEFYLFRAIKARYNMEDKEVTDALASIKFIHVHGSLGKLPWQGDGNHLEYGFEPYSNGEDGNKVPNAAKSIIIIGDTHGDTKEFNEARAMIRHASSIFILGFGYHPDNLFRLGLVTTNYWSSLPSTISGTIFGLTRQEYVALHEQICFKNSLNEGDQRFGIKEFMRENVYFLAASGWNKDYSGK